MTSVHTLSHSSGDENAAAYMESFWVLQFCATCSIYFVTFDLGMAFEPIHWHQLDPRYPSCCYPVIQFDESYLPCKLCLVCSFLHCYYCEILMLLTARDLSLPTEILRWREMNDFFVDEESLCVSLAGWLYSCAWTMDMKIVCVPCPRILSRCGTHLSLYWAVQDTFDWF
jgi:hypothetical protein